MSPPFLFPLTQSTVLPDPSNFFSPNLLSSPIPTNGFYQNFVLKNASQPEYIHPYLIKSTNSSLSVSYPLLLFTTALLQQLFVPDLTISASKKSTYSYGKNQFSNSTHVISSYSDLGVTLDIPNSNLRFFLVRGSPFVTASVTKPTPLSITTVHRIVSLYSSNDDQTKYTLKLNNTQTWFIYTSSPINFNLRDSSEIDSNPFSGIIRIAVLPDPNPKYSEILDKFSSCYPVSGDAKLKKEKPFSVVYKWQKKKSGDLLILAHPLHLKLLSKIFNKEVTVLHDFKYRSIDGDLVGVVGDSWVLETDPVPVTWHSIKGADFGFGISNDHHFHLGYFLYGIAVLTKTDPAWGEKYKPQAYSLVTDFLNLGIRSNPFYTRLRCFDLYKLHSWASGVTEFEDGRNQESTSEAVNAYYSAALLGLAYGDTHLFSIGSTLTALEISAAQMWWHVKEEENLYQKDFVKENRIVGVLWANKRDSKLWWATAECRECRLSIQVLPLLPITEPLFSDAVYAKELVDWTLPSFKNKTDAEGWKGFTFALQGTYDKERALKGIRKLKGFDDGNSFSNLLWWIHSR